MACIGVSAGQSRRLEDWFRMMGFGRAARVLVSECVDYGDERFWARAGRVPDTGGRFMLRRCYSPWRFLEDAKGFPQDLLRVAVAYRAACPDGLDGVARDRLWDATARGVVRASRAKRVRGLPLSDGMTTHGRPSKLGNARLDFEARVERIMLDSVCA